MKKLPFKTALFDLDGVLIDTEPQYAGFWGYIGSLFLPEIPDFANQIKGKSLKDIFDVYFPDDLVTQMVVKQQLVASEKAMSYPLFPHALEVVKGLRDRGLKVAIVTSSDGSKMKALYKSYPGLPDCFDMVFTAEHVTRSKPAPDCYINAAKAMNTDISECFVFEDSINGMVAARDAGAHVVGLTTTLNRDTVGRYADEVWQDLWDWWQHTV